LFFLNSLHPFYLLLIVIFIEDYFIVIDLPGTLFIRPCLSHQGFRMQMQLMLPCYFHDKRYACNSLLFLFERENTGLVKIYNFFTIESEQGDPLWKF
jgi:hypothetical protein